MNFKQELKKVMVLYPEIPVKSTSDYIDLINIHNILAALNKDVNPNIVKLAFESKESEQLKNTNDYYYLIFKAMRNNQEFKKVAYPLMYGMDDSTFKNQYDIDKWAGLVHKIYDAVYEGSMSFEDAIDHFSDSLDKESSEDISFKKWVQYYKNGEHLKYSDADQHNKTAFQFPLNGSGLYPLNYSAVQPREQQTFESARNVSEKKQEYLEWKNKLYSAIRRLDKLLRQSENYVNPEVHRDLADLLHNFDQEVRSLRHEVTASDVAFKFANKFKKVGFSPGFDVLTKFAQEFEQPSAIPESLEQDNVPVEPTSESIPAADPQAQPEKLETPKDGNAISNVFTGISGASEDEYSQLAGEISLGNASDKLEEVAALLADRRVVRHLAEFDIMLDKIGIASMFPELAEAQSKLIDAYSYALTRVTKMLGMVSSGKSLSEISEAKKREISDKAMKEVDKTFDGPEQEGSAPEVERGAPAIQKELQQAKLPTELNAPEV